MDTNRDRTIQSAIGGLLGDIAKNIIPLTVMFAVSLVVAATAVKLGTRYGLDLTLPTVMLVILVSMLARFIYEVYIAGAGPAPVCNAQSSHYVLMICGSGGHTEEMIKMIERSIRPEKSSHRRWAIGKDDEKSCEKVLAFEQRLLGRFTCHGHDSGTFDISRFGRARYVHQSWLTTPFTALRSLFDILRILVTPPHPQSPGLHYPGVIVTNGPGTGFLFLFVARALRLLHIPPTGHMRTLYVESWARVKSLSLTGKLIQRLKLADNFIVQSRFLNTTNTTFAQNLLTLPQEPNVPLHNFQ